MEYFITFLEGLISFLSPCMLPMLPVYLSYFAGSTGSKVRKGWRVLPGALAFVAGFTLVFCALGLFSGSLGMLLTHHRRLVDVICGIVVIVLGLSFLEMIHLPFFRGVKSGIAVDSILSAFLFGMVFSISLTPCVGAFLGAALMMASTQGGAVKGVLLLLVYSMGLGIPFLLSALLIDQLSSAFAWIKRHYGVINRVCGGFLILVGVLMMMGWLNHLLSILAFR